MNLDLTSLKNAVVSLERSVRVASSSEKMAMLDQDQKDTIRAGVIQNFEFTYELSWKFMQRWLRINQNLDETLLPRTRKDLFRLAARQGLVRAPEPWFEYGDARNLTSHAYSEEKAKIVFQAALKFAADADYLLKQLEARNG